MPDASDDMKAVINTPTTANLTPYGFGVPDELKKSSVEAYNEMHAGRLELLSEQSLREFAKAREWLRKFPKTSRPTQKPSWHLREIAEKDIGLVSNGAFLAAAAAEGFQVVRQSYASPHAYINIPEEAFGISWDDWTPTGTPSR